MNKPTAKRRSQAERRAESRQAVLDSACRLFGENGYNDTSLEEIAADCQLTIRPIYHYFGNKQSLFEAATEVMEQRILDSMMPGTDSTPWKNYLKLCEDPGFRQIVLIDSPVVLGRERWKHSAVSKRARELFTSNSARKNEDQQRAHLLGRIAMAALAEAALAIAEAEDVTATSAVVEGVVEKLLSNLAFN